MSCLKTYAIPFLAPAFYLERLAFNAQYQFHNQPLKELVARVVAVVAPIFYLYQIVACFIVGLTDFLLTVCHYSSGIPCIYALHGFFFSIWLVFCSIVEIPHKLINGPLDSPNYSELLERYDFEKINIPLL